MAQANLEIDDWVRIAFDRARQQGKPDWQRMSIAVLKNRLLDISERRFSEKALGYASFSAFLKERMSGLVDIDQATVPPTAVYRGGETSPAARLGGGKWSRIRPDLWRAVMDIRSGQSYFWDVESQSARSSLGEDVPGLRLPTVSDEDLTGWRKAFATQATAADPAALQRWIEKRLPASELPRELQGEWSRVLKENVQERLKKWFETSGLQAPSDMILGPSPAKQALPESASTDALRRLVLECVAVMTPAELSEIRLNPQTVLRIQRRLGSPQ